MAKVDKYKIIDELYEEAYNHLRNTRGPEIWDNILTRMNKNLKGRLPEITRKDLELANDRSRFRGRTIGATYNLVDVDPNLRDNYVPNRGEGFRYYDSGRQKSFDIFFDEMYSDNGYNRYRFVDNNGIPVEVSGDLRNIKNNKLNKTMNIDELKNYKKMTDDLHANLQYASHELSGKEAIDFFDNNINPLYEELQQQQKKMSSMGSFEQNPNNNKLFKEFERQKKKTNLFRSEYAEPKKVYADWVESFPSNVSAIVNNGDHIDTINKWANATDKGIDEYIKSLSGEYGSDSLEFIKNDIYDQRAKAQRLLKERADAFNAPDVERSAKHKNLFTKSVNTGVVSEGLDIPLSQDEITKVVHDTAADVMNDLGIEENFLISTVFGKTDDVGLLGNASAYDANFYIDNIWKSTKRKLRKEKTEKLRKQYSHMTDDEFSDWLFDHSELLDVSPDEFIEKLQDTVAHETRHFWQNVDPKAHAEMNNKHQNNFKDWDDYYNNALEVDAREYAEKYVNEQKQKKLNTKNSEEIINNDDVKYNDVREQQRKNLTDEQLINMTDDDLSELADNGDQFDDLYKRRQQAKEKINQSSPDVPETPVTIEENMDQSDNILKNKNLSPEEEKALREGNKIWEQQKAERNVEIDKELKKLHNETEKSFNSSGLLDDVDAPKKTPTVRTKSIKADAKKIKLKGGGKAGIIKGVIGGTLQQVLEGSSNAIDEVVEETANKAVNNAVNKTINKAANQSTSQAANQVLNNYFNNYSVNNPLGSPINPYVPKTNFKNPTQTGYTYNQIVNVNPQTGTVQTGNQRIVQGKVNPIIGTVDDAADDAAEALGKAGKLPLINIGLNAINTVGTYKEARRKGHGVVSSAVRAAADFALFEMLGLTGSLMLMGGKALGKGVVKGTEMLYRENRRMNSAANNQVFGAATFQDTQQLATMRQSGMEMAKMAQYNLQQTLMGQEAQHLHR